MSEINKPRPSWQKSMDRIKEAIEKKNQAHDEKKQEKIQEDSRYEIIDNSVTKSNELSRAYYRFNLTEKRVMESMISLLDPRYFNKFKTQDIVLSAIEYAKTFNVNTDQAYRDLEKATKTILRRVLIINNSLDTIEIPLMSKAIYSERKGEIIASFNPEIIKHLVGLKKQFSSYKLKDVVEFKSSYTWRIYEIVKSWTKKLDDNGQIIYGGWFGCDIDEFKKMVGIPNSYQMDHIKKRVIEKAINELSEKAGIDLSVDYVRKGRLIKRLDFTFVQNNKEVGNDPDKSENS